MAVRQYIGARYVPLYAGDWDSTKNYEPLTIVTDANGNSFTSLRDVPAGTALTDRSFWIQTSSFSAAVDALTRRMSIAENFLNTLDGKVGVVEDSVSSLVTEIDEGIRNNFTGRYFLFVSDSFGDNENEWVNQILNRGILQGENLSVSGIGFTVGSGGSQANGILAALQAYTGDKTKVTDIVIACGLNDSTFDGSTGLTALIEAGQTVLRYIEANYDSRVHIGYIGNALDDSTVIAGRTADRRQLALNGYKAIAALGKNSRYMANVEFCMCGSLFNFSSDRLHPSDYGTQEIVKAIVSDLRGGYSFQYPKIPGQNGAWKTSYSDGTGNIRCSQDRIYQITGGSIPVTPLAIDTFLNTYFNIPLKVRMQIRCYKNSPAQYFNSTLLLTFEGNTLYVQSEEYSGNAAAPITANNILINNGLDFSFPTLNVN